MKIKANAKINLTLDICSKRSDGYHIIDSVMQSVSLFDELELKRADNISIWYSDIGKCGEDDICYKAAKSFFERANISGGAEIRIEKKIPCVAGVGGSSSDAAAVIVELNRMYGTDFSVDTLCEIGLKVGADVPFCIVGGTVRVGGIGEKLEPIKAIPSCAFLIVVLSKKSSTKQMYEEIDSKPYDDAATPKMIDAIENRDLTEISKGLSNAFKAVHGIETEEKLLLEFAPLGIGLSGSGPAVYAVFENEEEALNAQSKLKKRQIISYVAIPREKGIEIE